MNIAKLVVLARLIARRNRYVLADTRRPAKRGRVNLEWWKPLEESGSTLNLGDCLSPIIVEWMLEQRGLSLESPVRNTRFLAAVGSVLGMGMNSTVVWGSGCLHKNYAAHLRPRFKRLDIRAVRGPLTAEFLRARGYMCPEVFGDPAILLTRMYQPTAKLTRLGPLLVTHIFDEAHFDGRKMSMAGDDYGSFIDAVCSSELVITSSLHAIILAECYGTPAVLLAGTRADYDGFKYEDWYRSTGRTEFPIAASVEEALQLAPAPLPKAELLEELREGLIASFPYDLWEK